MNWLEITASISLAYLAISGLLSERRLRKLEARILENNHSLETILEELQAKVLVIETAIPDHPTHKSMLANIDGFNTRWEHLKIRIAVDEERLDSMTMRMGNLETKLCIIQEQFNMLAERTGGSPAAPQVAKEGTGS